MPRLDVGIPAFNEEKRVARAIRSVLAQPLPKGVGWGSVVVVASGCTDGTAAAARAADPIVEVVETPERTGKADALREIFRRSTGEWLLLLNADAEAFPGSVESLLRSVRGIRAPFAAMARPVPEDGPLTPTARAVGLMWQLQDDHYRSRPEGAKFSTLSEELLLLSGHALPPLPSGTVNDGGFIAGWLDRVGGRAVYVRDARVAIEIPRRFPDHVRQRQRIVIGARQLADRDGMSSGTVLRSARQDLAGTARLFRQAAGRTRHPVQDLGLLGLGELLARTLAALERRPAVEYVRWRTIPG